MGRKKLRIAVVFLSLAILLLSMPSCTESPKATATSPPTAPEEVAPAPVTVPDTTPESTSASTQIELGSPTQTHQNAVEVVLTKAETDSYYKYVIYASRILAVKHPEIYLQADGLFLETITTNIGFKKSYEITDVKDNYLLWQKAGGAMSGPPFSLDYVDFTKYDIIKSSELYPEGYPVLPYLDRRMLTIATTLKPVGSRLNQLEKAEQYYFYLKEHGAGVDELYLIYCDNESAYMYDRGNLIEASNLESVGQVEGNPILIFNEASVWYPLMGRDDTSNDATLKQVIDKYATSVTTPELTDFEALMVEKLVEVTALEGLQKDAAIVFAARSSDYITVHDNRPFQPLWQNFTSINEKVRATLMGNVLKESGYLSPISAYLAAITAKYEGEAKLEAACDEYCRHATPPGTAGPGGLLWMLGIVAYTIDDMYYAHAGT